MILQALKEYYDRKADDPESGIAPLGFEKKQFQFVIVIDNRGHFVALEDLREKEGKRLVGKTFLVPRSEPRSGARAFETTFLLWDHVGYLLGYPDSDDKAAKQHQVWLDSLRNLPAVLQNDEGVRAVKKFYEEGGVAKVKLAENWESCSQAAETGSCNMTFRLAGDSLLVPCRELVVQYQKEKALGASDQDEELESEPIYGICLVTGEYGQIARIHTDTRINKDSKKLVGFQRHSGYDSYRKEQAYNAPVSKLAEFAYTTALNSLLQSERSKMQIGDAKTVFWSERRSDLEASFVDIFGEPQKDDPERGTTALKNLYGAIESGALTASDNENRFYVLGLAPNSARIAVRFWIVDTVAGMAAKIIQHFDDLRIAHGPAERGTLSLWRLLVSIAVRGESENIPPNVAGDTMRAILVGLPYPRTLLQGVIRRLRAGQPVTYPRAALIKACINRDTRYRNPNNPNTMEELKMSLDTSNRNIGYRLGRLFATLEKIQLEANPKINSTIRERFYGSASGTPVAVFSNLMRLKNHHLAKLKAGRCVYFEQLLGEILDGIEDFAPHLGLADQGRFAIGYYHQNQSFYTKKCKSFDDSQLETEGELRHE